ncbi:MAG: cytochrome c biogenesis protein CcsA [bacterium]|nr:cytochrome c biogenesis protein CcsA [bacterium]
MLPVSGDQLFLGLYGLTLAAYGAASLMPIRMKPWLLGGGIGCHLATFVIRTIEAGRLPLVGVFDTLSFFALSVACLGLVYYRKYRSVTFLEGGCIMAAAMLLFDLFAPRELRPLPPVLRTFWFEIHVVLSFVAYGLFAIAFLGGIDYFLSGRTREASDAEYSAALWGYLVFSVAMIAGGIWAYFAWGSYWLWTPKELWTTIVWFFYSLYLHARIVRGWKGSTRALLAIVGFAVVMFTYLGVGLLMKSSHTF